MTIVLKQVSKIVHLAIVGGLLALCLGLMSPGFAQDTAPKALTLEELEAHIAEQKAALEAVVENREKTELQLVEVEEALAEASGREDAFAADIDKLCKEREALEPGSLDDCLAALGE